MVKTHVGPGGAVGIDAGIESPATLSDGIKFFSALSGRCDADAMKRAKQVLVRCRRGSKRRQKVRARLERSHERIANTRSTHLHRVSAVEARSYSTSVVEDLALRNMVRGAKDDAETPGVPVAAKSGLNRSILDAGMGKPIQPLTYKAKRPEGRSIKAESSFTSQDCSGCGTRVRGR